jgi:ABC-2 type transport system permease protein
MTAPTLAGLAPAQRPDPQDPVPLARLVDVESRKMVDTRSSLWLLVSVAALVACVVAALGFWGSDDEVSFGSFASNNSFPLRLLLPLVAVLAVTSEWSQRGALTTFALVPRRARVMGAKALAALLVTLAATALTFVLSAVGTLVASAARGIEPVWNLPVDLAARLALANLVAVAFGFTVAVVIRSSAPALVVFLGTMLVFPMLSSVAAALFGWWAQHGAWLDLSWSMQYVTSPDITAEQWAQVGTSALVWIALPLALGLRRVLRVEVR